MVEIGLRFIERALFDLYVPFGLVKRCRRLIEILLRRILLFK